jgi:hypothetical protein
MSSCENKIMRTPEGCDFTNKPENEAFVVLDKLLYGDSKFDNYNDSVWGKAT